MKADLGLGLRHDVPRTPLAWGVRYERKWHTEEVRLNLRSQVILTPGELQVFIEHKNILGMTMHARLSNLLGMNERFYRTVHAGRRTDPILFREDRSRYNGLVFDVAIKGSF